MKNVQIVCRLLSYYALGRYVKYSSKISNLLTYKFRNFFSNLHILFDKYFYFFFSVQPQTWKTSEVLKDEYFVKNSADICDKVFDAQLQSSDCQSTEISEHPRTTISLEAQRILDVLPEFDVLEKPYLVILENENNNLFLN